MKASSPKHVHDNNQTYFADFLSRLHDPMHHEKRGGETMIPTVVREGMREW